MIDFLLEPMQFLWNFLPLWIAIPVFTVQILIMAAYMTNIEKLIDEQDSHTRITGYDPEDGFRFDPDDFD